MDQHRLIIGFDDKRQQPDVGLAVDQNAERQHPDLGQQMSEHFPVFVRIVVPLHRTVPKPARVVRLSMAMLEFPPSEEDPAEVRLICWKADRAAELGLELERAGFR